MLTNKTCIIMAGINDVYLMEKAVSIEQSIRNYADMIELAVAKGYIPVAGIWPSTHAYAGGTVAQAEFADKLKTRQLDYCIKKGVHRIDFASVLSDAKYFTGDGLHPNRDGYVRMGDQAVISVLPFAPTYIIAFGDSITAGYPYTGKCPGEQADVASWTAVLRDRLKVPVVNQGIAGQTTAEILTRMKISL